MEKQLKRRRPGTRPEAFLGEEQLLVRKPVRWARRATQLAVGLWILSSVLAEAATVILSNANRLGRQCHRHGKSSSLGQSFAIVSCSDGSNTVPGRSFEGIMDLVSPNKRNYAKMHGYTYVDASSILDRERPPSWSKIKAVQEHLRSYDWVFWNDADSLVMNFSISLEQVLASALSEPLPSLPDMIITGDVTGVNAGMFFMRDSPWSRHFLELWWNQTSFILPFGNTKSGDNDALKHLVKTMPVEERKQHILVPQMQCLFNSYLWTRSWKNAYRLLVLTKTVWRGKLASQLLLTLSNLVSGVYSKGDFMVHLAGIDNKREWMEKLLGP